MFAYWLMFFSVLFLSYTEREKIYTGEKVALRNMSAIYFFTLLLILLLIGFRVEVGGDWFSYMDALERMNGVELNEVMLMSDPGYRLLNYVSFNLGFGIYGVNLACGFLFLIGLNAFCQTQPRPSLALLAAIPYLVIVISMGYTRQSVAIGLSMLAFTALIHRGLGRFIIYILFASLFHKTAIILIPLAALMNSKNKFVSFILILAVAFGAYFTLLSDSVDNLYKNYVEAEYHSTGALIRVAMCLVPSVFFLIFKRRFRINATEYKVWLYFSYASIVCFVLVLVSPATTAIDRVALYLLPIQLVVLSHIPSVLPSKDNKGMLIFIVTLYCFSVQFVWLFAGRVAYAWLPYKFYPFEML